jgi:hypothetical protein
MLKPKLDGSKKLVRQYDALPNRTRERAKRTHFGGKGAPISTQQAFYFIRLEQARSARLRIY